jgi:hypothetical protein
VEAPHAVRLNVRWRPDVDASQRALLEQQLHLTRGERTEGTTWTYWLPDPSADTIGAIVKHPSVEDTAHINRTRFRPEIRQDRERYAWLYSAPIAAVAAVIVLLGVSWWSARARSRTLSPAQR